MITKIKDCFKRMNLKQLLGQRIKVLVSLVLVMIASLGILFTSFKTVVIADGDKSYTVRTSSNDAETILASVGVKLEAEDNVIESDSNKIIIERAKNITVTADGNTVALKTQAETVEDALFEAKVSIIDSDIVNYDLDEKITDGMKITVTRVKYVYKTKVKDTVGGKVKITYKSKLVNGEVEETKVVKKKTIAEKKVQKTTTTTSSSSNTNTNTVKAATKAKTNGAISELAVPTSLKLNKNGIPAKYKKVITGKATAYYTGTRTSTGKTPQPGYIAVDPREIPYGTKMYIVSNDGRYVYGYAIAADTGGFIHNSSTVCDLFFNTRGECIQFGRRDVTIYILD